MTINEKKYDAVLANAGLKQCEVADRSGLSRARLYTILNSKNIRPITVGKIAKALGCDVTDIIDQ